MGYLGMQRSIELDQSMFLVARGKERHGTLFGGSILRK